MSTEMSKFLLLQRLRHENLINLIEVFRKRRKLYLVFEYVDHTVLEELEDHPKGIPSDMSRNHVFQVLRGIEFCHQNNVIIDYFKNTTSL
jgi:cyclin-dependent kinase-like